MVSNKHVWDPSGSFQRWIDQYMTRCMTRSEVGSRPVGLLNLLAHSAGHIGWSDRQRLHVLLRVVEGHAAAGLQVTPIVDEAGAGLREAAEHGRVRDTCEVPAIHNDLRDAALVVQAAIEHCHWKPWNSTSGDLSLGDENVGRSATLHHHLLLQILADLQRVDHLVRIHGQQGMWSSWVLFLINRTGVVVKNLSRTDRVHLELICVTMRLDYLRAPNVIDIILGSIANTSTIGRASVIIWRERESSFRPPYDVTLHVMKSFITSDCDETWWITDLYDSQLLTGWYNSRSDATAKSNVVCGVGSTLCACTIADFWNVEA